MCDPVTAAVVIGVGMAASGAAAYKTTRENNKNMKRQQNAKNQAFRESMERQSGYADEAEGAFNTSIEGRGADAFNLGLEDASQKRLQAFDDGRLEAPSDYSTSNAPKNVQLYQNKIFGEAEDKSVRDSTNLANLNAFNDTLFNKGLERNDYARAFGNLSDKAQRDAGLTQLDMNSAAFNAYKPLSPFWSILGGAGNMASMGGGAALGASGGGAAGAGSAGASGGAAAASDRRLKEDLVKIGVSPKGINIYEFKYIDQPKHKFRGVIAQELEKDYPEAIEKDEDGILSVNYDLIDVNFEQLF